MAADIVFFVEKRARIMIGQTAKETATGTIVWKSKKLSSKAVSGPFGEGALPNGEYKALRAKLLDKTENSYKDKSGNCWMQVFEDVPGTGRTQLGLHPDGGTPGTEGCIGLKDADTSAWYDALFAVSKPGSVAIEVKNAPDVTAKARENRRRTPPAVDRSSRAKPAKRAALESIQSKPFPSARFEVLRADDMLHLGFELTGFTLHGSGKKRELEAGKDAKISVFFDPQHLAEEVQVFANSDPDAPPNANPYAVAVSKPARLDFPVDITSRIPFTLEALLTHCEEKSPSVFSSDELNESADEQAKELYDNTGENDPPLRTAIELPRHLVLQPFPEQTESGAKVEARFDFHPKKLGDLQRSVLWHARLASGGVAVVHDRPADDWACPPLPGAPLNPRPECLALLPEDRRAILEATVADLDKNGKPAPYQAKRPRLLAFTALGAWLDLDATFDGNAPLRRWTHRTTHGRDHYVKVVYDGFLFPIGVRAQYIREVERRIAFRDGAPIARLEKRYFVEIKEPQLDFPADVKTVIPDAGPANDEQWGIQSRRKFGFTRLDFTRHPLRTPPLDPEWSDHVPDASNGELNVRWIRINGKHHLFRLDVTDAENGSIAETGARQLFVRKVDNADAKKKIIAAAKGAYEREKDPSVRTWQFAGQKLALTPPPSGPKNGDANQAQDTARVPIVNVVVGVDVRADTKFHPIINEAAIRLPELDQLIRSGEDAKLALEDVGKQISDRLCPVSEAFSGLAKALAPVVLAFSDSLAQISQVDNALGALVHKYLQDAPVVLAQLRAHWFKTVLDRPLNDTVSEVKTIAGAALDDKIGFVQRSRNLIAQLGAKEGLEEIRRAQAQNLSALEVVVKHSTTAIAPYLGDVNHLKNDIREELRKTISDRAGTVETAKKIAGRIAGDAVAQANDAQTKIEKALELTVLPDILLSPTKVQLNAAKDALVAEVDDLNRRTKGIQDRITSASSEYDRLSAEVQDATNEYKFRIGSLVERSRRYLESVVGTVEDAEAGAINELRSHLDSSARMVASIVASSLSKLDFKQIDPTDKDRSAAIAQVKAAAAIAASVGTTLGEVVTAAQACRDAVLAQPGTVAVMQFYDQYVKKGYVDNPTQLWAQIISSYPVNFDKERLAGLVLPDLQIRGLSRALGPVSSVTNDLGQLFKGNFDPTQFFRDLKLLGGIRLIDVLEKFDFTKELTAVPGLKVTPVKDGDLLVGAKAEFKWTTTKFKRKTGHLFQPAQEGTPESQRTRLSLEVVGNITPGEAKLRSTVTLERFALEFANLLQVQFESISFEADTHSGTKVHPKITGIRLLGDLEFFQKLSERIGSLSNLVPRLGFDAGKILAGFGVRYPEIQAGAFSLSNIGFSVDMHLSLRGEPVSASFAFAERERPFTVAAGLLGGGGFFSIEVEASPRFLRSLELALEFGGVFQFSIVVASGSLFAVGGIYAAYIGGRTVLSAYLRVGGHVDVLGIITISIQLVLSLTYADGKLSGAVQVNVDIEFLFFSVSTSFTVEKTFAGSDSKLLAASSVLVNDIDLKDYQRAFVEL